MQNLVRKGHTPVATFCKGGEIHLTWTKHDLNDPDTVGLIIFTDIKFHGFKKFCFR